MYNRLNMANMMGQPQGPTSQPAQSWGQGPMMQPQMMPPPPQQRPQQPQMMQQQARPMRGGDQAQARGGRDPFDGLMQAMMARRQQGGQGGNNRVRDPQMSRPMRNQNISQMPIGVNPQIPQQSGGIDIGLNPQGNFLR